MSYQHLLTLLGLVLMGFGYFLGSWGVVAVWLGLDFLALAIAHHQCAHGVFGKRRSGTLPLWSWLLFLPLLAYTYAVWHLLRMLGREPSSNEVTPQIFVGRRLLPLEVSEAYDNYIDLTAEFAEPPPLRDRAAYRSFPILDGAAPRPEDLLAVVNSLRPGRTFIHCAQGHGRTGLFALALLLRTGAIRSAEEGMRMLHAVRPAIRLNRAQWACIHQFAKHVA
jgi:protein-tyrosine phosphatase